MSICLFFYLTAAPPPPRTPPAKRTRVIDLSRTSSASRRVELDDSAQIQGQLPILTRLSGYVLMLNLCSDLNRSSSPEVPLPRGRWTNRHKKPFRIEGVLSCLF